MPYQHLKNFYGQLTKLYKSPQESLSFSLILKQIFNKLVKWLHFYSEYIYIYLYLAHSSYKQQIYN